VERRRRVHHHDGVWFVILTDMSLVAAVVAAIAILL
jgi:hypothetical protein